MKIYQKRNEEFEIALLSLDRLKCKSIFESVLEENDPVTIADNLIVPVLETIGEKWNRGELALSQVYMSGKICEELIESALPLKENQRNENPKMAIAVFEDYHILGKRIVCSVIRASGYALSDWGHGLDIPDILGRVEQENIEILLLSTLMLSSSLRIKELTKKLKEKKINVKVVVGGAPFRFDEELWKETGADAMGKSASEAVRIIEKLIGGENR